MCLRVDESIHPASHPFTSRLPFLSAIPFPPSSFVPFTFTVGQRLILSSIKPEENCVTLIFFFFFETQKDAATHLEINFRFDNG